MKSLWLLVAIIPAMVLGCGHERLQHTESQSMIATEVAGYEAVVSVSDAKGSRIEMIMVRVQPRAYTFRIDSHNYLFAGASITVQGFLPNGKALNKRFQLKRDKSQKQPTWSASVQLPADMFVTSMLVKSPGRKKVPFFLNRTLMQDCNFNLLLSSIKVRGYWTRPRLDTGYEYAWSGGSPIPKELLLFDCR